MRQSDKLQRLISTLLRLAEAFDLLGEPRLAELATSWRNAIPKYDSMLAGGASAASLAAGLEQGLSEVPAIVRSMKPQAKARALQTYYSVMMREAPESLKKLEASVTRILGRGRILSAQEYYLARAVIDAGDSHLQSNRGRDLERLVDAYDGKEP